IDCGPRPASGPPTIQRIGWTNIAELLHKQFGVHFRLLDSRKEMHRKPFGTDQQFLYCLCRIGRTSEVLAPRRHARRQIPRSGPSRLLWEAVAANERLGPLTGLWLESV